MIHIKEIDIHGNMPIYTNLLSYLSLKYVKLAKKISLKI